MQEGRRRTQRRNAAQHTGIGKGVLRWKKQLICVGVGFLLYGAAVWQETSQNSLGDIPHIERQSHGEGTSSHELYVDGLVVDGQAEDSVPVTIDLREKEYTKEERAEIYEKILASVPERILQDNASLQNVTSNLKLPSWIPEYGIKVRWSSDNPDLLDLSGQVHNEDLETGAEVTLSMELSDGKEPAVFVIPVMVCPANVTDREAVVNSFLKQVRQQDEAQLLDDQLTLPTEYQGKKLTYKKPRNRDYIMLPVFGVLIAILLYAQEQTKEKQKWKDRDRQLLLDYSEVVSKLMVFIGAGMTISLAWERVVQDYELGRKSGKRDMRYAYEEMSKTYYQLKSGVSEGQAFQEFGSRCRLQPYLKLSSLLEQNRRTGTKNLRTMLSLEMVEAWEQRKNLARKLGEEAGTKLLLPLFLMLGIVMVMIMVPAMLSMGA